MQLSRRCNHGKNAYSEEAGVPTLDERVAYLEGRVEEHARNADGMREALVHLEARMDRRFEGVETRFAAIEDKMDRRFEAVDSRFSHLENTLVLRFDAVDTKIGRLTAIVVTALAAMLAITGGALLR